MPGMQLGWVDFSKEQKNKVLSVIDLLSEPGAVDELGVGIVRDAFSDIFFPGTSTIQTRAKYFIIVPYLLYELENDRRMTPDRMIEKLHEEELEFIEVLKKSGEDGVIGGNAGKKLKRKPSEIYWNGLRTYDIFTGGRMSMYDYAKVSCFITDKKNKTLSLGNPSDRNEENSGDDLDAVDSEFADGFWRLPKDYDRKTWRQSLSIKLTKAEAEFLRNQIIENCPGTLMAYVLETKLSRFNLLKTFDDLDEIANSLPEGIRKDYYLAKTFADFIYGAHIRYNVILLKGENEDIISQWDRWRENISSYSQVDLDAIVYGKLKSRNRRLEKFLYECRRAMIDKDIDKLDRLIISREIDLKGRSRSKLYNAHEFNYKGWVGIGKLQYRLRDAQNILRDIFEGLGEMNA